MCLDASEILGLTKRKKNLLRFFPKIVKLRRVSGLPPPAAGPEEAASSLTPTRLRSPAVDMLGLPVLWRPMLGREVSMLGREVPSAHHAGP